MSSLPKRIGKRRHPSTLWLPFQKHPSYAGRDVQAELLDRLANEKPKDPLDLRNRLDSQGKRYGKVIEFRWVCINMPSHTCLHYLGCIVTQGLIASFQALQADNTCYRVQAE